MKERQTLWLTVLATTLLMVGAPLAHAQSKKPKKQTRESFKFVQMCDTQLGAGGYSDDVARFAQAAK